MKGVSRSVTTYCGEVCRTAIFSGIVTLFSGLLMMLGGLGEFIATGVTFAINAAMAAAGSAAIYAELRGTKEGPDTDELASVFA